MKKTKSLFAIILIVFLSINYTYAQIQKPPIGANQKASVTQWMGITSVTVTYNSPDVHAPDGKDRKGKIWGELVPYGSTNHKIGLSTDGNPSPWRVGANENTTVHFSHDMLVEEKHIKSGTYGLFMIPGKEEWEIIFSKRHTTWGSFFYTPSEDALRVKVKPVSTSYHEWLTFNFENRQLDSCNMVLMWEELSIPIKLSVNIYDVYIEDIRKQMIGDPGFFYNIYLEAANFCLRYNTHLEEGLTWINYALEKFNAKYYSTAKAKFQLLYALDRKDLAKEFALEIVNDPSSKLTLQGVNELSQLLIEKGLTDTGTEISLKNIADYPNNWEAYFGAAKNYYLQKKHKQAKKYAQEALMRVSNSKLKKKQTKIISDLLEKIKKKKQRL